MHDEEMDAEYLEYLAAHDEDAGFAGLSIRGNMSMEVHENHGFWDVFLSIGTHSQLFKSCGTEEEAHAILDRFTANGRSSLF